MSIFDKLRHFKKTFSLHQPLIEVFVYKENLLHNLREYQSSYPKLQFAPVLKANAYGHGLEQVLDVLKNEDLPFICVDSHFELRTARAHAPNLQFLVIGFSRLESIQKSGFKKTSFTIMSLDQLKQLSAKLSRPRQFHLKLDTGMHRQGILPGQYQEAIKLIQSNPNILLEGLCSHLADPDNQPETLKQIANWNNAARHFKTTFPEIKYTHLSATGGVSYSNKIDANLVRLGIGFYGNDDYHNGQPNLKPALEMRSLITGTKIINAGEKIGYGLTFTAEKPMNIATVPVGYFEGMDRRLSNQGYFKVNGEFCPLVGRLSMDIATIDITENKNAVFGSEVVVISAQSSDKNSVENISRLCGTIPYDILVHIPQHLRRTVI